MNNTYRRKTTEFQAVKNTLENAERLDSFLDEHGASFDRFHGGLVVLQPGALSHTIRLPAGKWLIRWSDENWSVMSPSVFEQHYEPSDREQEEEEDVTFFEVALRVRTTRGDEVHTEKRSFEIETEQVARARQAADIFAEAIVATASEHGIDLPRKP